MLSALSLPSAVVLPPSDQLAFSCPLKSYTHMFHGASHEEYKDRQMLLNFKAFKKTAIQWKKGDKIMVIE